MPLFLRYARYPLQHDDGIRRGSIHLERSLDEAYKDSIIMQNSVRDSFTPALRLSGYDINTTDENQLNDALDLLIRQKPLVYAYYVDETGDEMAMGNAAMALVYSGEAAYAMELK